MKTSCHRFLIVKIVLPILFVTCSLRVLHAQVLFLDQQTKKPVAAISLYNEAGELIGFTDKNGQYKSPLNRKQALQFPLAVNTQHLSYENKSIVLTNLSDRQLIELTPKSIHIEEIAITPIPKDVIVLTGYYRTLEIFDYNTKYFSDGIIKIYLPKDGRKMKYNLLAYRIFQDSLVQQDYDEKMGNHFSVPRVPYLSEKSLVNRITQYARDTVGHNKLILKKENMEAGYIELSDSNQTSTFYIDWVLPDSIQLFKKGNTEARLSSIVNLNNYNSSSLEDLGPFYLNSASIHYIGKIAVKEKYGYVPHEILSEFYVMETTSISPKEYKSLSKLRSNIYRTEKKSRYSYNFWEDIERFSIPPINEALQRKLRTKMKLME